MPVSDDVLEAYGRKELDKYTHWVYVLRCGCHFRTFDELERKAEKRIQRKPHWLREAFEANRVYYIGQTENLEKRLGQHFQGKFNSDFTELFKPHDVFQLEPKHSRNQAERRENHLAELWSNSSNKEFAYSQ